MSKNPPMVVGDFIEVCEHLERLSRLAELARDLHIYGLERNKLLELIGLFKEIIEHNTGRTDLPLLDMLSWLQKNFEALPSNVPFSLKKLKERLPHDSIFPLIYMARQVARQWEGLPPPPTPRELVDEVDALIEGFTSELIRHTRVLTTFFDVIRPEAVPWIIGLVQKSPWHVRTSLGEPLCIWWLGRVLGELKPIWREARGPLKAEGVEVDAVSVHNNRFAVAEVKVAKPQSEELIKACSQAVRAAKMFMRLDVLRYIGFKWLKGPCIPSEVAVVTLYDLKDHKRELRSELRGLLKSSGISEGVAAVYDINDLLDALESWPSKAKGRYKELFKTLNKILEATS